MFVEDLFVLAVTFLEFDQRFAVLLTLLHNARLEFRFLEAQQLRVRLEVFDFSLMGGVLQAHDIPITIKTCKMRRTSDLSS